MQLTVVALVTIVVAAGTQARPQGAPMPYSYNWKVNDVASNNYYGQQEAGDVNGRVEGSYHVLLADNRLMTVSYHVDGDSGYVAKITYEANPSPFTV